MIVGEDRSRAGLVLLWVAAAAGVVHGAFSLFWAFGGRWLLDTVGGWAVDAADRAPVLVGLALTGVGLVKIAAALVPPLATAGRIPGRRFWRAVSWVGGVGLIAYGGIVTATALAVIAGVVVSPGGYDPAAMAGHAFLWDPLFLLWGACLTAGLALTRGRARRPASGVADAGGPEAAAARAPKPGDRLEP